MNQTYYGIYCIPVWSGRHLSGQALLLAAPICTLVWFHLIRPIKAIACCLFKDNHRHMWVADHGFLAETSSKKYHGRYFYSIYHKICTWLVVVSLSVNDGDMWSVNPYPFQDKWKWHQVIAWYHQTTGHYLSQCWPRSISPYGVARPQWVNSPHFIYWLLCLSCLNTGKHEQIAPR